MKENDIERTEAVEETEIDLIEVARTLWLQRKRILKWCACGAVLGLIIAFSIPREYTTAVKLAPEVNGNKMGGSGLGALAAMAGISTNMGNSSDAVSPLLYPDVVNSVPFITSLFDVEVPLKDNAASSVKVSQYLEDDIRRPWWSAIFKIPGKIISLFKSKEDESAHRLDNFQLTKKEYGMVEALKHRISTSVDNKTSVITVSVSMQDPLVSAVLADTVVARLQEFITDYRTNKARQDLAYAQKLNEEAKQNYYSAQQHYAEYQDRNQGVVLHSVQTTRERLENEATLAFNLYNQTAQQVQLAQAKVQETTPVYAVVSPATVPLKATSPKKPLILVAFTFLAGVACCFWILFGDMLKKPFEKEEHPENKTPDAAAPENVD